MNPIIIALDYQKSKEALDFIEQLSTKNCAFKVGSELFTACGPDFVRHLVTSGFRVFLDLKFHDIPNTVAAACRSAAELGVWMINIHASGGTAMMKAARESLEGFGSSKPLLIAVTVLTSMNEEAFRETASKNTVSEQVLHLSSLAWQSGLDGVVCSAQEARAIKDITHKDFLAVTPGIRLQGDESHDQQRIMTPAKALQEGADYLVIGRSVTQAENPKTVLDRIQKETLI